MKRLFSLLTAAVLAVSLAACGSSASSAAATPTPTTEPIPAPTEQSAPAESETTETVGSTEETTTDGKALVVYYSATGTTKRVAQLIADAIGADLFEVEPAEPYTTADLNYSDKTAASPANMTMNPCGMWRWFPLRFPTGTAMTPYSSAIPSGGAVPRGR